MKQIARLLIVVPLLAFIAQSCSIDNDDEYSLNNVWLSLGFIEKGNTSGYDFMIINDKGDTLLPVANLAPSFEPKQKQRVLTNYTILDKAGASGKKFQVRINNISEILYKDVIELTAENADSLGSDPVHVTNIWIADSLLNVEFQYYGGSKVHFINLAIENNNKTALTEPVELKFLHNDNADNPSVTLNGLVTFNLNKIKKINQNSVEFKFAYTDYYGQDHKIAGTYKY